MRFQWQENVDINVLQMARRARGHGVLCDMRYEGFWV